MYSMECDCVQKSHTAPIRAMEVSENAILKVAGILSDYNRIFVVCDKNSYEAAGKKVVELLKADGRFSHMCMINEPGLPTADNIGKVLVEAGIDDEIYDINTFSTNHDYILVVGSGSVNDICRIVSYRLGLEYGVVGTAPSMDGYISSVAPLIIDNRKIVYTSTCARHIIIDLNICANAPYDMLLAGVGDMIGKYIPAFEDVLNVQKKIKIPFTVTDRDKFIEGVMRGRTFRERYTLLQYLYDNNCLKKYAEYAYCETMKYNFSSTSLSS